jgi:hypothetical protein
VAADVARDLATACRMSDEGCTLEIQGLDHCCEIIRVSVHVISFGRLTGSPMPAPVNCHTAIAVLDEE